MITDRGETKTNILSPPAQPLHPSHLRKGASRVPSKSRTSSSRRTGDTSVAVAARQRLLSTPVTATFSSKVRSKTACPGRKLKNFRRKLKKFRRKIYKKFRTNFEKNEEISDRAKTRGTMAQAHSYYFDDRLVSSRVFHFDVYLSSATCVVSFASFHDAKGERNLREQQGNQRETTTK